MNQRALEAGAAHILRELDDRGLLNGVDDDLHDEIGRAVAEAAAQGFRADGFVVVPVIPTPAMIEAGCDNNPTSWNEGTDLGFAADVANDVYRAMLSAATTGESDE
jgi:hypothetical protein